MNREEMIKQLKAGKNPLDVSIKKWHDIVNKKTDDDGLSGDNCALCFIHKENCKACPIYKKTFKQQCKGTPYIEIHDNSGTTREEAQIRMYHFLLEIKREQKEKI
jgi:hypothetical protein